MLRNSLAVVAIAFIAFACKTTPPEELVAKVNGEGIVKKDFEVQVERNMARYRGQGHALPPGIENRIKESVLRRMVDDAIIQQKAKESGVVISAEELSTKFKEHKDRFRTEKAFQDYLTRSNNSEQNMREDLERNLLRDRLVEKLSGAIDVTAEEVSEYFEQNKHRFKEREQVKVSRILLRVAPNAADAERNAAKTKANSLAKQVKGGADFGSLAKEHSDGPEKVRNGDLGWLTRGRMPAEFDNVVFTLEPNTVSGVTETKLGYEIMKVWEKKPERQRPLEEVKDNIEKSLLARKRNEKRREVLRSLKKDAQIEHLIKFEQPQPTPPRAPAAGAPVGLDGKMQVPQPPRVPEGVHDAAKQETATPEESVAQ